MSGNCINSNKYAFSARCRKALTLLSQSTVFYVEDNRGQGKITWGYLQSLIRRTVLGVAVIPSRVYVSGSYVCSGSEDEIYCSGDMDVTLAEISDQVKSPSVNSDGGTVTVYGFGTDAIQSGYNVIVDGDSGKYGANVSKSEWRSL